MKILYIAAAVLSVPATIVLSNLFWLALREARGVVGVLSSPNLLQSIVTAELLSSPPNDIARFAQPLEGGYEFNMRAFQQADRTSHNRGRSVLGLALVVVILGSGIVGFLALGWLGLVVPIINILILHTTFVGSTQGGLDDAAIARAIMRLQVVAVILHRWYANSPSEAAAWLENEPRMKPLGNLVTSFPVP